MSSRRPLKVLEIITGLDVGGAEVQLLRRVPLLREEFEIVVCSLVRGGSLRPDLERAGARVVEIGSRGLLDVTTPLRLARAIMEERPDVVHCHLFRARLWGVPIARLMKVPVVLQSEHALTGARFEAREHSVLTRTAGIALGRLAHSTVAISRDTATLLRTIHRVPADRIVFVPNGIHLNDAAATPVGEPSADVTAMGRLHEQKGFEDLIRAVAILRGQGRRVTCEIAGDGPLRADHDSLIRELGLTDLVTLVGIVRDPVSFIRRGRVFVMPSRWEPFGIAALEALAAGVPVIATDVDGLTELVAAEAGVLVRPHEPHVLAEHIGALLDDSSRRRALAKRAAASIRAFDLAASTRRLAALYRGASKSSR